MDNHPVGWPLLYETPLGMFCLYGKVLIAQPKEVDWHAARWNRQTQARTAAATTNVASFLFGNVSQRISEDPATVYHPFSRA